MGKKRNKISEQVRRAVNESGLSRYRICKTGGIDQAAMSRFMSGKMEIKIGTLDALADVLGLEIVVCGKDSKGRKPSIGEPGHGRKGR